MQPSRTSTTSSIARRSSSVRSALDASARSVWGSAWAAHPLAEARLPSSAPTAPRTLWQACERDTSVGDGLPAAATRPPFSVKTAFLTTESPAGLGSVRAYASSLARATPLPHPHMNASRTITLDDPNRDAPDSGALLPQVGDVLEGKYVITRVLGEGGMGVVFEARHLRLDRAVALKFLHPSAALVPGSIGRFEQEARAAALLRGPNVAHVLDVETTPDGVSFMVMDLLQGRDLQSELERRGAFPIEFAVDVILQVCRAMAEAHGLGIVHRDLKPSNIFLCDPSIGDPNLREPAPLDSGVMPAASPNGVCGDAGQRPVVKVFDFGISLLARPDTERLTTTSISLGTPLYMSPEQVRCSKRVDARTDIWSMGVILFELLAGAPPFVGTATAAVAAIVADRTPSIRDERPDVPATLDAIIGRALAKDADQRFQNVDELADALAPFGSGRYRLVKSPSGRARVLSRFIGTRFLGSRISEASARFGGRRLGMALGVSGCLLALPAITFAKFDYHLGNPDRAATQEVRVSGIATLTASTNSAPARVGHPEKVPAATRQPVAGNIDPLVHRADDVAKTTVAAAAPASLVGNARAAEPSPVAVITKNDNGSAAEPARALSDGATKETSAAPLPSTDALTKTRAPATATSATRRDNPLYL